MIYTFFFLSLFLPTSGTYINMHAFIIYKGIYRSRIYLFFPSLLKNERRSKIRFYLVNIAYRKILNVFLALQRSKLLLKR